MKKIVVGSTNPVKVEAVRRVVQRVWQDALVTGVEAASGVSAQPQTDEESIHGAIHRAQHALVLMPADLGVGVEGNTVDTEYAMFSTAWIAIIDASGQVGLGSSGRFELPEMVATAIRSGGELGPLMDQLIGGHNTKQKQGAVGIFTNGLLERTEALETGVICALCRFVAPEFYNSTSSAVSSAARPAI